jgi:hypothetical protein
MVHISKALVIALVLVLLDGSVLSLQGQAPAANKSDSFDIDKSAKDCVNGTSSFTMQQCTFLKQAAEAVRQINQVVKSGEMARLPRASQNAMVALVDALQAAIPLMKQGR